MINLCLSKCLVKGTSYRFFQDLSRVSGGLAKQASITIGAREIAPSPSVAAASRK
jgi:hypothetical protein